LLGACNRVNQLMPAFTLVKEMKESGATLTEEMFLKLIELCSRNKQAKTAVDVFEAMRSSGVSPGVKTYTSLLTAMANNDSNSSLHFEAKNRSVFIRPRGLWEETHEESYDNILKTKANAANNLFRVFLVFGEMKSSGIQPDVAAYNALINSCAAVGDLERAMGVLKEMYDDQNCFPPDAITFTSLIKTAANAHDIKAAEQIFSDMQQRTNHFSSFHSPSEKTFKHMMNANLNANRFR